MTAAATDHGDIQALVRGFKVEYSNACFLFLRFRSADDGRKALDRLGDVTSAASLESDSTATSGVNVALTFAALHALGVPPDTLDTFPVAFRQGMAARGLDNGDVGDSLPGRWKPAWAPRKVHLLVAVYGKSKPHALARSAATLAALDGLVDEVDRRDAAHFIFNHRSALDLQSSPTAPPSSLPQSQSQSQHPRVYEHFGFVDGVGETPVRGFARDELGGRLDDAGRWHALAAGEFLFGYADEAGEKPEAPSPPALARNGTFLVLRLLEQHVQVFRRYVIEEATRRGMSADVLAELMVGRRRDGTPMVDARASPGGFVFSADPDGGTCPFGSHVRRSNPRDHFGFGTVLVDRHRILRRGITYGPFLPVDAALDEDHFERGLVFIALNASIERQFEFIQRQWLNGGDEFDQGDQSDPIVGNRSGRSGGFVVPGGQRGRTTIHTALPTFVTTRGGDYFFLPGIAALKWLACGRYRT